MCATRIATDDTPSHPEFRRHERGRLACTVFLLLPNRRIVEARTVDISVGGMRLVTPMNLPLRLVCGAKLIVPGIPSGAHTVMAQAQVSNIVFSGRENGFLVGLRFTSLPASGLQAISAYLHEKFMHTSYRRRMSRPQHIAGDAPPAPPGAKADKPGTA